LCYACELNGEHDLALERYQTFDPRKKESSHHIARVHYKMGRLSESFEQYCAYYVEEAEKYDQLKGYPRKRTEENLYNEIMCHRIIEDSRKFRIFDNDAFAKTAEKDAMWAFVSTINTQSTSKHLHGMYMMGHGSEYSIGSKGWLGSLQNYTVVGPIWDVSYGKVKDGTNIQSGINGEERTWTIGNALTYHLGAIIIQACESDGASPRNLKSASGIFQGETGFYVPMAYDIACNWGESYRFIPLVGVEWTYGGQQNTVPFPKLKPL